MEKPIVIAFINENGEYEAMLANLESQKGPKFLGAGAVSHWREYAEINNFAFEDLESED